MKLWVARNPDGSLYLFDEKPIIYGDLLYSVWRPPHRGMNCMLKINDVGCEFSGITFRNSPQEVEIKLIKNKSV